MKKNNISNYCKLATILFINAFPIRFAALLCSTSEVFFEVMITFYIFFFWNVWALIVYYLTKWIKNLWLRDTLFYALLFLFLFIAVYGMSRYAFYTPVW